MNYITAAFLRTRIAKYCRFKHAGYLVASFGKVRGVCVCGEKTKRMKSRGLALMMIDDHVTDALENSK